MKGVTVHKLEKKVDERGWLLKMLMKEDIKGSKEFGEIYITTANPGSIKGSHYHRHCTEWFCIIKGKGKLKLLNRVSNRKEDIMMGDDNMVTVEISPNIAHAVKNVGEDMMYLLAYTNLQFDHDNPDTVPHDIDF